MGNSIQRPIARFEDFEVRLETGEVWKAGRPIKVQDQPFKVLAALLERPGQIVTREELRQLIWPEKSFGDFDHAINPALAKLRATLGDSADVPHLIETLPRRNGAPSWSRDGKSIYFYSVEDPVGFQLWKIPQSGGSPVRVTTQGGVHGIESMDGRFLFYSKFGECGVWKKSLDTNEESILPIHTCDWFNWEVTRDGIYFLNPDPHRTAVLSSSILPMARPRRS